MSNTIISLKKGNQTLTEKVEALQIRIKELEKENYELCKNNIELGEKLYNYESIKKKKPDMGLALLNSLFISPTIQSCMMYTDSKLKGDDINE